MKFQIARNKNGTIFMCTGEIRQYYNEYYLGEFGTESMWLPNDSFPQLTFENSPQEVELSLPNLDIIY